MVAPLPIPVFIPRATLAISCCSSLSLYTYHLQIKTPPLHPQFHIEKPPPGRKFPLLLHLIPFSLLSVLVAGITVNTTIRLIASL